MSISEDTLLDFGLGWVEVYIEGYEDEFALGGRRRGIYHCPLLSYDEDPECNTYGGGGL